MSIFSQVLSKLVGKRTLDAVQPLFSITAPIIVELVADQLSDDDVILIMNACRRKLRKTVPQK